MRCPNCGTILTFDPGEPGDFYGPPIPAGWGCDNCGYDPELPGLPLSGPDLPDFPPPDADMGDGRLSPEDELRKAALSGGQP